jgi:lysophospholipase
LNTDKTVQSLLTPPDNWQWGEVHNENRQKIRYGWNCPKNAKALIVLAEGRTEVIEEYFELIRDLNNKGYACAIMDWQGHGLSYRYFNDNARHHSEGFVRDVADFTVFMSATNNIAEYNTLPKLLLAHSMGANIMLRYMAGCPEAFQCAYLTAPMLGLNPKRIIKLIALPVLKVAKRLKKLDKHAFGQSQWNEIVANITKYKLSSDPVRREVQTHLFKTRPELQCGGITFGWLTEALKSIALLHDPDFCKKITTPVCIAIAGRDIVVNNEGAYKTASLLPDCHIELFEESQHQIHRECDNIRNEFIKSLEQFLNKNL